MAGAIKTGNRIRDLARIGNTVVGTSLPTFCAAGHQENSRLGVKPGHIAMKMGVPCLLGKSLFDSNMT